MYTAQGESKKEEKGKKDDKGKKGQRALQLLYLVQLYHVDLSIRWWCIGQEGKGERE